MDNIDDNRIKKNAAIAVSQGVETLNGIIGNNDLSAFKKWVQENPFNFIDGDEKSITPPIVCFEELIKAYTVYLKFKPASFYHGIHENLKEDLIHLIEVLVQYREVLNEIEDATLKFIQKSIAIRPPVYISRSIDSKTEKEYFHAKTFLPQKGGKKKEIKVYLGKASDFNHNTRNPEAKLKGEKLLQQAVNSIIEGHGT